MSILNRLTSGTAALALAATHLVTSAFTEPAEASPRIIKPDSCRQLDRELARDAQYERNQGYQTSRNVGNAARRGDANNVGKVILGDIARRGTEKILKDDSHIRKLESDCAADLARQEAGNCVYTQNEIGRVATRNGRMVGDAEGGITQTRNCTSTSVGNGPGILTTNGGPQTYYPNQQPYQQTPGQYPPTYSPNGALSGPPPASGSFGSASGNTGAPTQLQRPQFDTTSCFETKNAQGNVVVVCPQYTR